MLYGKCSEGHLACSQFELNNDRTFQFYTFMDVGGGNVLEGKWEYVSGDTLMLNTTKQPNIKKTYFEGKVSDNLKDKVKIKISSSEFPLTSASLEINDGELTGILNDEGIAFFNTNEVRNITYSFLNRKETIEINNRKLNHIQIFVRDLELGAISDYFVDEIVIAKRTEILFYPNSPERKYSIRRSRFGKKSW